MGSFYANTTYLDVRLDEVRRAGTGPAYALAAGADVVVFPADEMAAMAGEPAGVARVTAQLGCRALTVSVYDSDIFSWTVHVDGAPVTAGAVPDPDEYFDDGPPGQPPDAAALVSALGRGDATTVATLLARTYVFADELHRELVGALELPAVAVGLGYRYLAGDAAERSRLAVVELSD